MELKVAPLWLSGSCPKSVDKFCVVFYAQTAPANKLNEVESKMNRTCKSILLSLFMIMAAPVYAESGMAIQIFECEFTDDGTADELMKITKAWLKAARETTGGKDIIVGIRFPIAEGGDAGGDFRFMISAPNFAAWGEFTDAYEGSKVAAVDEDLYKIADCGQSTIWEGMVIR